MDNKKYLSAFNEKGLFSNKVSLGKKSNNQLLNLQKIFERNPSFASGKIRSLKSIDSDKFKSQKFIHNKVKQYEIHPFRQFNLKIIGEDIKNKIHEMNKENIFDTHLKRFRYSHVENRKKSFLSQLKLKLNIEKSNKRNSSKLTEDKNYIIKEKKEEIKEITDENNDESNEPKKIILQIPQEIKKKKNKKKKLDLANKKLIRNRRLNRAKNLYDSMDDDESEKEEEDEFVINPETKTIAIFDFLLLTGFLYYFIFTTFSLSREKCFCPLNKGIKFSDALLFINDILCILDLFISFFRGYYNYNYKLIKSNKLILIHYLKYDFIFDLLSAIPIFSITKNNCLKEEYYNQCSKYEMKTKYLLFKFCSLLKVAKIKKIWGNKSNQALDIFIGAISDNYQIERAVAIFMTSLKYIGIFHLLVCLHIFIGNHTYSNWLIFTKSEDESFINIYIKSLYFIVTTLTTVGYGDIVCQSLLERIFQIIILAIGSVLYPYIVSLIGNTIRNDSTAAIQIDYNLAMLEHIRMNYPNIPFKLYHKILKYLESQNSALQKYDMQSFIDTLPFAMKNSILFAMHEPTISNFKFFKNNNNSVFIAEVLNSFIPSISKKDEFLVYEGETMEEIIFLKDGKISLNAAINSENPIKSINKYFIESFAPFTTEEEKKLINDNKNAKSSFSVAGEMTYDKAKNKLNEAFRNIRNERTLGEKSQFLIQTFNTNMNKNFEFDIKGGAIINDEGNYQYLKIIDIRKNEHFGYVFISLNRPCPLSLQIKSKLAELFLLKKEHVMRLSKNYPNIWRKIYRREFHNLRTIKKYTFSVLRKYIEENQLLINKSINEMKLSNYMSSFDLNLLEKSAFVDKSKLKSNLRKSFLGKKEELNKSKILNYYDDNINNNLNLAGAKFNVKSKFIKNAESKRTGTFDDKINNLMKPNFKHHNFKVRYSLNPNFNSNINYTNIFKSNLQKNTYYTTNNRENKQNNEYKRKINIEKMKRLKSFLLESKKYFMNNRRLKTLKSEKSFDSKNNKISLLKLNKKPCLRLKTPDNTKYKINIIKSSKLNKVSNKSVGFNLSSNDEASYNQNNSYKNENYEFNISEKLVKDLKNICENEANFSFCSTKEESDLKFKELTIENNLNFEIISSYPNLNKLTNGKYIEDFQLQKKLKFILQNYYLYKNNNKTFKTHDSLLLKAILFPLDSEKEPRLNENEKVKSNTKHKKHHKQNYSKSKKIDNQKYNNYSYSTNKLIKINRKSKIIDEITYKTMIKNKKLLKEQKLNNNGHKINSNLEYNSTLKMEDSNLLENKSENEKDNSNSKKVNKSKISSCSKKSESSELKSKGYFGINIKKISNIYNNDEIEYIIDQEIGKSNKNIIYNNDKFNKSKKKINNYYKSKNKDKNKELINQMFEIKIPDSSIITNNIITTSTNLKSNKNEFNSVEKMKNIENVSIYNFIQKNINKNLQIIDNKSEKDNISKRFCNIF